MISIRPPTQMRPKVFHKLDALGVQFLPEFHVTVAADRDDEIGPGIK